MNAKISKRGRRIVFIAVISIFALIMGVWIGTLLSKNAELNSQLSDKQDELVGWQEENAALDALVNEENETALMEEYARKAGYVYSDERVYINGS
ncbi:MAG: septum formation initiator family protein [Clostridiales bacterium]|nr:septum formation initiator family protein [Clostridiales bacterium]MCD7827637.1 septum formation initiator family protein [Clostridiales bacterium]